MNPNLRSEPGLIQALRIFKVGTAWIAWLNYGLMVIALGLLLFRDGGPQMIFSLVSSATVAAWALDTHLNLRDTLSRVGR